MKKILLSFIILINLNMSAKSWDYLLNKYKKAMGPDAYCLISKQYQDFISGNAPVIADEKIIAIEIKESGESLVDLKTANQARISVMSEEDLLKCHDSKEDIDPTSEKFSKVRKSVFDCLVKMIEEIDKLAPKFGYKKGQLEIKLFEGLRDINTQKKLFDGYFKNIKSKNPEITDEQAYDETSKFVSPYLNNVPTHSTGAAIDIHLYDNKNKIFCDMGKFNKGGETANTFSENINLSDKQKTNRLLFLTAATRAGLTNYIYEFWHYSYGDRYALYYRANTPELRVAIYNSIK